MLPQRAQLAHRLLAQGAQLIVALPAVVAYNLIGKKISDIEANVGVIAKQLLAFLKLQEKLAAEFGALGENADHGSDVMTASGYDEENGGGHAHPVRISELD